MREELAKRTTYRTAWAWKGNTPYALNNAAMPLAEATAADEGETNRATADNGTDCDSDAYADPNDGGEKDDDAKDDRALDTGM